MLSLEVHRAEACTYAPKFGDTIVRAKHGDLEALKNRVGELKLRHGENAWRTAVAYVDPYTNLPMQRRVPSRAYFKWVELVDCLPSVSRSNRILHLCEAPGGFVQAHWDIAKAPWVAHSLQSGIRFKRLPPNGRILPGNGDILDDATFQSLAALPREFDIVTADGSVDFESDHARVEECNFHLVLRQALVARAVLKPGGSLVLKVFDVTTEATWGIVQLLTQWFARVRIVKPASSRASNGELYLVATELMESLSDPPPVLDVKARVSSLWDRIDPALATDLATKLFADAQFKALRAATDLCSGRHFSPVDRTKEWWHGPGKKINQECQSSHHLSHPHLLTDHPSDHRSHRSDRSK